MIRVLCPHCRRRYRTVTEVMGRTVICRNCRMGFSIGELRPPFNWEQDDLAEDSWIGVEPPAERRELQHCIMCEAPLEEGVIICTSCGMNQITGMKTRRRYDTTGESRPSIWQRISMPYVLFALCLVVIVGGGFWLVVALRQSASSLSKEIALHGIVNQAMLHLADSGDPYGLADRFGGRVHDGNLPYFVRRLSARDPGVRRAVALLIGYGDATDLSPLVTQAIEPEMASAVREALEAIGPRRLLALSEESCEDAREAAAVAICLLFDFERLPETLDKFSGRTSFEEKHRTLNAMVRFWPEATGTFQLMLNGDTEPRRVRVEQYGPLFYMYVGVYEFRTSLETRRTFEIPIARWCAATGSSVDPQRIREWVSGHVRLSSPLGVGWQGILALTARQAGVPELPGLVPHPPEFGESLEVPLNIIRVRHTS